MRVVATDCDLRALLAQHLGVDVARVTDDVHLSHLGADWLDRLELTIIIESQFAGVDGTDADVRQIEVVGDSSAISQMWARDRKRGTTGDLLR